MQESCYPQPKFRPRIWPKQAPKPAPSYIEEKDQVGNWLFYNGAGDKLHDFSGHGNHGTIHGAKWTDKYSAGWALNFDGDDYVEVADDASLRPAHPTIEAWAYPRSVGWGLIAGKLYSPTSPYQSFTILIDNNGYFCLQISDGSTLTTLRDPSTAELDNWSHVGATYDGSDIRLLVNGSEVNSASYTATIGYSTNPFAVGAHITQDASYLDGLVSRAGFYSQPSVEKIKSHFEATRAIYGV